MAYDSQKNTREYRGRKSASYVHGNTVRKLYVAEPFSNEAKSFEQLEWEARQRREQQRKIHRSNRLNFLYTMGVSAVVAVIFFVCFTYLNMQTEVKNNSAQVSSLQEQLNTLKSENDELEVEVNAGIDYDQIYDTAVNEMGMVYPDRDQVITYEAGESEYVKQYQDIPSDK